MPIKNTQRYEKRFWAYAIFATVITMTRLSNLWVSRALESEFHNHLLHKKKENE